MSTETNTNNFKNNWKNILLIVLSCIVIALVMSTTCQSQKLSIAENNILALTDTIKSYELKNGDLLYEQQGYILKKQELEKYLEIKEKEINELERKLGSAITTIARLEGQVRVDTIELRDSIYIEKDVIYNDFSYQDDWLTLYGTTTYKNNLFNTSLNTIAMNVPLKVGTTADNKWFATSSNPYVSFTNIEGVSLEKAKQKRWSVGVQAGIGVVGGFGISGANDGIVRSGWIIGVGPYFGLGVSYKFFEF
jgi:hypothetical protein